ncbi:hypothetical protein ES332_D11G397200v1 [Gossypium tomentosum]|uniref:Uncharacterized protein n=1 Tax=Gossypium tomentosum TaxID=34277 RepID=A0A5D2IXY8_GOSTO|nr:hypothetical protein ES332_D11G397200v1 [Gossypium tomentosum]
MYTSSSAASFGFFHTYITHTEKTKKGFRSFHLSSSSSRFRDLLFDESTLGLTDA